MIDRLKKWLRADSPKPAKHRARLALDCLDSRITPSAGALRDRLGQIVIEGTTGNDSASVTQSGKNIVVNLNGAKTNFAKNQVNGIVFVGDGGKDKLSNQSSLKVQFNNGTMCGNGAVEADGTVTAIDATAGTLTFLEQSGTSVTVTIASTTSLERNEAAATLASFVVGDAVEVKYDPNTLVAAKIEAGEAENTGTEAKGTITAIDTTAGTVTFQSKSGTSVTVTVNASTVLERNGAVATLSSFAVGDSIKVKYDPTTLIATKVEAKDHSGVESKGTITAIDTTAGTLTFQRRDGTSITISVTATTVLARNGATATLSSFVVGDTVEVKYNPTTLVATKVESENDSCNQGTRASGTVTAVDTTAGTLTFQTAAGASITVNVNASTVFEQNCASTTLASVVVGDSVTVKYDANTLIATKVEINAAPTGSSGSNT